MSGDLDLARRAVSDARRRAGDIEGRSDVTNVAEALDELARVATDHGVLDEAAAALEEAAGLWIALERIERGAQALLLAAITRRLAGQLAGARHDIVRGLALPDLLPSVHIALVMEQAEQALAGDDAATACSLFDRVVAEVSQTDDELIVARVRQRRAAARAASGSWGSAADDLVWCSQAFDRHGDAQTSAECMLGAAVIIAPHDPGVAEAVWSEVDSRSVGLDVAGSIVAHGRNALIGANIAAAGGRWEVAGSRADFARSQALQSVDAMLYLECTATTVEASLQLGDVERAYERLASAWVTLEDLLGPGNGRVMVRPQLEQLRDRVGGVVFDAARAAYEERRRAAT